MIISQLAGGLGNQMFQYAAGRALAFHYDTICKLDRSFIDKPSEGAYTQRHYELDIFHLKTEFASHDELRPFKLHADSRFWRVLHRELPTLFRSKYIAENSHNYMRKFLHYGPYAYLRGFWQSEKYFSTCRDAIRKDFTFKYPPNAQNAETINLLEKTHSVSLHVRRGDYANDKSTNEFHGLIGLDYYSAAIKEIGKVIPGIELFVFSDDIEWCRQNLLLGYPTHFIDINTGAQSHEDLRLMSHCKHNIIANSSFSWWGAWLNRNPEKIVVAPKQWFRDKENSDIYPSDWIRL